MTKEAVSIFDTASPFLEIDKFHPKTDEGRRNETPGMEGSESKRIVSFPIHEIFTHVADFAVDFSLIPTVFLSKAGI